VRADDAFTSGEPGVNASAPAAGAYLPLRTVAAWTVIGFGFAAAQNANARTQASIGLFFMVTPLLNR